MKFRSLVVAVVCSLLAFYTTNIFAQARASSKSQAISVDPVGLFLDGHEIHAQYEWKASSESSWLVRALYASQSVGGLDYSGFGIGAGYRFYIADSRAITGLAVAPLAEAYFFSSKFAESQQFISVGGEASYKWIFESVAVEPLFGIGIAFGGDQISYLTKTRWYLGIFLGYAW